MEIFILILSSLISVLSPANLAADKVAEGAIRSQFKQVEVLKVRVDNTPVHNVALGKIDRVRIAGRGLYPLEEVRIDTLEFETDPLNISFAELRSKKLLFQRAFGFGTRIVIRGEDVLRALKSPAVTQEIRKLLKDISRKPENKPEQPKPPEQTQTPEPPRQPGKVQQIVDKLDEFRILEPKFEFLGNKRFALSVEIEDLKTSDRLKIEVESGIEVLEGRRLKLIKPTIVVNGQPLTEELVKNIEENLSERYDLQRIENLLKIRARIFKIDINQGNLELAGYIGVPANFKVKI